MSGVNSPAAIRVIDSHTGGEPTRVVVEGAPDIGDGAMASRRAVLSRKADWLRTALVTEPRGSAWMVGAILQQPVSSTAVAGAIFCNNTGYLNMCGHGLIGVVTTLAHLGRIDTGRHRFETPVGDVMAELHANGNVSLDNVSSYRSRKDVTVDVPEFGPVVGDVAWGGNWFFLVATDRKLVIADVDGLTQLTLQIRRALVNQKITGDGGAEIDHIELVGPPGDPTTADARNFVLCPGDQYDRSPCGTGTSAKLACLAADGMLGPGQIWRQESIVGSVFTSKYQLAESGILPTITGRAFITGDLRMVIDPDDPFRFGIK
jgi:4-hydroxyproline epimerase